MKILVTGGAGFIGSNLVHYLLGDASDELGVSIEKVINLDKLTYAGNRSNLDALASDPRHLFVQGDIGDEALVGALLREHDVDAVMHLAAESHVDRSIDGPEAFILTNVVGTFRLLDTFRKYLVESGRTLLPNYGKPIADGGESAFLHVSTDEVFGSLGADDPAFCESTPYAPNSPYSASKAGSDHLARAYHHTYGMPVITTNCSNNYGPFQFPEKLLPLMIQKVLRGESLPVYGDGSNVRDWLFVEDHCRGLAMALVRGTIGETYVIGGKCEMKNIDVVKALIETVHGLAPESAGKTAEELITFVRDRPGHDRRYAIDPSRIEEELGWAPRESFSSGLRKTVQWYLDHQDWIHGIEDGSYRGERLGTLA
ncbi:dTDP-glucose 4,6-dehydratase [Luteolibacter marinus]|uniref:dTDP-glucose 4,6-dehydratase n=1 Tax=Luteolibacter marinus TaxID=2776705 RepID=UPI001866D49C|nr:dTDP-glucose 4,6-dehydratase [Luteolibacter marinus]